MLCYAIYMPYVDITRDGYAEIRALALRHARRFFIDAMPAITLRF